MKRSLGIVFSGVLVALSMLLTSCRGDWYYELPNDYVIDRSSAHMISLVKKNLNSQSYSFVLEKYYVFAVCVTDEYILTSGIQTAGRSATDEELMQEDRVYYAVNYETDEILGPFVQEDNLKAQLSDVLEMSEIQWIYTEDINSTD